MRKHALPSNLAVFTLSEGFPNSERLWATSLRTVRNSCAFSLAQGKISVSF